MNGWVEQLKQKYELTGNPPNNRGRRKGHPVTQETRDKISATKKRKYNEELRTKLSAAIRASWTTGKRAKYRVVWDNDMDQSLKTLMIKYGYGVTRHQGPKIIGVCEEQIQKRLKELGYNSEWRRQQLGIGK